MGKKKKGGPGVPQSEVDAIADRMAALRFATGLNQTEFCKQSGIATNTWNQWERAEGRPDIDLARRLTRRWRASLDWIYDGDESSLPNWLVLKLREWEKLKKEPI